MEKKESDLVKKIAIFLGICIIGICGAIYILNVHQSEGDPYFLFTEVPVDKTINSTIIHLEDMDIMNIRGIEVRHINGKITRIYFRYSQTTPEINDQEFYQKYGSRLFDPSSRKYLEYKGVYYYAEEYIP